MPHAIIIGAGIGGLAAAIALLEVGLEVSVFERAAELREVGAGLTVWSNAIQALTRLGVADDVLARASVLRHTRTTDATGRLLTEMDLAKLSERAGYPSVCIHRAEMQFALLRALPPDLVRTSSECVGISQSDTSVTATFADGRIATADILIGADGLRSAVRKCLRDPGPPRYAGYTCWRGIGPHVLAHQRPDQVWFAVGRGCHFGIIPCAPGRIYWFVTKNGPANQSDPPGGHKSALFSTFAHWHPDFRTVIEASDESAIFRNDIVDRPPCSEWGRGRITLLGDSIHGTTPNLGQGACMALEDAVILASCLRDGASDLPSALRRYEDLRRDRTSFVIRQSHQLGGVFQWENPLLCWMRDRLSWVGAGHTERLMKKLLIYQLPNL